MVDANVKRVWVRSLGSVCRVRVESVEIAKWLLDRLTEQKALVGLTRMDLKTSESGCTFEIPNSSDKTLSTLETTLGQIPDVQLMLEPESV